MDYKVIYTKSAEKDLEKLESKIAIRILKKIGSHSKSKTPLAHAKKLRRFELDTYRFRIGEYRAIFRLDKKTQKLVILVVLRVKHRKEVYK